MRRNVHWINATRLVETAPPRRNVRLLSHRAEMQARIDADRELLGLLLALLIVVTAVLVVWTWQSGWWS